MLLSHHEHGHCVVYGWERTSGQLAEATMADLEQGDIIDNRLFFVGIDSGLPGAAGRPHYRCLFQNGQARVCAEENLVDIGLKVAGVPITGSSVFFKGHTQRRLVPNDALTALYPDDAARLSEPHKHHLMF
jgi:hypothetical protein